MQGQRVLRSAFTELCWYHGNSIPSSQNDRPVHQLQMLTALLPGWRHTKGVTYRCRQAQTQHLPGWVEKERRHLIHRSQFLTTAVVSRHSLLISTVCACEQSLENNLIFSDIDE